MKSTKLSTKIYALSGVALAVGAVAVAILVTDLRVNSAEFSALLHNEVRQADSARLMQVTFKKQVQAWKDILLRGFDPANLKKYTEEFHAQDKAVQETGTALKNGVDDPKTQAMVSDFLAAHAAVGKEYGAALEVFTKGKGLDPKKADKAVKGKDRAATDLVDQIVGSLLKSTSDTAAAQEVRSARQVWTVSVTMVALFIVIGIVSTMVIRRMSRTLHQAVTDLTEGAEQVAAAAVQLSTSSQQLAQGSSEQAASLEETSASSEEINSMARKNTENSRSAADLVTQSQQKSADTNRSLDQMVVAMAEIKTSSDKISKIIRSIDEIAFQTNILALNAAVEAARAGEAGMGFAVVADEVRNLAQRCAQAAKDTAGLIEESITRSEDGRVKVDQVAGAIRGITEETVKVKTLVDDVNLGSQEQARGMEQIARAITQMEKVTQRTAANAEESASAAEELTAQSQTLKEVVDRLSMLVGGQLTGHDNPSHKAERLPLVAA